MRYQTKPIYEVHSFFPIMSGRLWIFLFVLVISFRGVAQMYVVGNTIISVKENTTLYVAEESGLQKEIPKVYIADNTPVYNFPKDSLVEIVYLANQNQPKTTESPATKKKSKKPLQPPIIKEDTEPENRNGVLSFNSIPKTPSAFLFADRSTKAALVQNTSFSTKIISVKKSNNNNNIYSFLLNDNQIKTSLNELLLLQKANLEENITRPPPFLSESHLEIA